MLDSVVELLYCDSTVVCKQRTHTCDVRGSGAGSVSLLAAQVQQCAIHLAGGMLDSVAELMYCDGAVVGSSHTHIQAMCNAVSLAYMTKVGTAALPSARGCSLRTYNTYNRHAMAHFVSAVAGGVEAALVQQQHKSLLTHHATSIKCSVSIRVSLQVVASHTTAQA
jgi:hypothetical protein